MAEKRTAHNHLHMLRVAAGYWLEQAENIEGNDESVRHMEAAHDWACQEQDRRSKHSARPRAGEEAK